jgi:membrane-associated phospholipid phosphatase
MRFVASALVLLVLGFITFIVYPAIPPWLAASDYGRVPGVENLFGRVLRWHPLPFHGTPIFYVFTLSGDRVAAMPSEHAAFPMLELLAFARFGWKITALLALWVLAVLFSIIYLGEHWVTDALFGWLYAVAIFGAVYLITRRR